MKYYGFIIDKTPKFLIGACYDENGIFQFYETGFSIENLKNSFEKTATKLNIDFMFFYNCEGLPKNVKIGVSKYAENRMN